MSSLEIVSAEFYQGLPIGNRLRMSIDLRDSKYVNWTMKYEHQCLEIQAPNKETILVPLITVKYMRAKLEETYSKAIDSSSDKKGKGSSK